MKKHSDTSHKKRAGRPRALCVLLLATAVAAAAAPAAQAFNFGDIGSLFGLDKVKNYAHLFDSTNDEAAFVSAHKLIERAGFKYENYYALADDGYITQLIRIINPLADASELKRPPIMIQHGQTANAKNFIMQSNRQHWPMPWPPNGDFAPSGAGDDTTTSRRPAGQGHSSNRSLAFMLANNGYDVWLTSTRGVDKNNRGYLGTRPIRTIGRGKITHKNMTEGESKLLLRRVKRNYWSFTLDDQIAQELPSQIATVLNVTAADKVTIFGYSNTALTTFAMLTIRPDISPFIDSYVAIAPVVFYNRLSGWFSWFMEGFMQIFPKNFDAELFLSDELARFLRFISIKVCQPFALRYSVCKVMLDLLFGQSDQFQTNLELPFFAHMLRPTSWKCLAHHLQIVRSRRLEKFDYGPIRNRFLYNKMQPPEYDIARIDPSVRIALVSGDRDCWANQATVDELRARLPQEVSLDLVVRGYNHLDLAAAFDVDQRVNLPLLGWLDARHEQLRKEHREASAESDFEARQDLSQLGGLFDISRWQVPQTSQQQAPPPPPPPPPPAAEIDWLNPIGSLLQNRMEIPDFVTN